MLLLHALRPTRFTWTHDGFRVTSSAFYRLALAVRRGPAILSGAPKAERKAAPNHIINVSYPGLCSIEQHI
jgi:hypothetical protein